MHFCSLIKVVAVSLKKDLWLSIYLSDKYSYQTDRMRKLIGVFLGAHDYATLFHLVVNFLCTGQYDQNVCDGNDVSCLSCYVRLPSCIGLKDGAHPFPTRLWKPDYITCYKNRTMSLDKCKIGYFHPIENACKDYLKGRKFIDFVHR